jgi:hypothetical protein
MSESELYHRFKRAGRRDADRLHAACMLGATVLICALALAYAAGWRAARAGEQTPITAEETRP